MSNCVFYCRQYGDCHLTKENNPPHDHCQLIATVTQNGDLMSHVGDLSNYFDKSGDGYKIEYLQSLIKNK